MSPKVFRVFSGFPEMVATGYHGDIVDDCLPWT